jgi:ABC-2 type transport system ATP-binding protein
MQNAIEINDISVRLGKASILNNISLNIPEGQIIALLGPSGAGKTTLVKAIMGMNPIYKGSIYVYGKKVPSFEAVSEIGYMAQTDALYEDITAIDNLVFFGNLYGVKGNKAKARAGELLDFTELSADKRKLVKKFSSGMKRRLSLAISLMNSPKVLMLDEPTVGIDPLLRKKFREQFFKLRDSGSTIFMTTHVMDEALNCDKVLLMRSGSIIAYGTSDELIERSKTKNLEEAFLHYIRISNKEAVI